MGQHRKNKGKNLKLKDKGGKWVRCGKEVTMEGKNGRREEKSRKLKRKSK